MALCIARAGQSQCERESMARFTIKVAVDAPRKLASEGDFHEVIYEQLTEQMPESVYFTDVDGNEHELGVEIVE